MRTVGTGPVPPPRVLYCSDKCDASALRNPDRTP